jgi:hypothetical protein
VDLTAAIVIVTLDRPTLLESALCLWEQSERRPDQFIVVDASKDALARRTEVLERHGGLFADWQDYVITEHASTAGQRNLSLERLRTDVVLFADDDLRPKSDLLGKLMEVFEADHGGRIGGVSGWATDWRRWWRRVAWAVSAPLRSRVARFGLSRGQAIPSSVRVSRDFRRTYKLTQVRELRACAMAVRTELVARLRFDPVMERYSFAEDFDLSYRIGRSHALVRRDDTILEFAVAAGALVPRVHYFLLSWLNPAYLIEKLNLGEPARRALLRRLRLSKWAGHARTAVAVRGARRPTRDWFVAVEEMIGYVWDGTQDSAVERYRRLQTFAFGLQEDESIGRQLRGWQAALAASATDRKGI